jgi:hypothetical protein
MPRRGVAKSNFPRFEAVVSTKMDHGTYDMNDEEHTDHSCLNSSVSTDLAQMKATESTPETPNCFEDSQSNTENMTSHSDENEDGTVGSLTFSENESLKNREVSWSDSDGSTYISENNGDNDSVGSNESARNNQSRGLQEDKANLRDQSKVSGESFVDVDLGNEPGPRPPKPSIKSTVKPNGIATTTKKVTIATGSDSTLRRRKPNNPLFLENVDYYSEVDVASTNDGLSAVEFISKEDTSSIFCRRLIPLEIPIRKRRVKDDVSALSSEKAGSVMPTGDTLSVQAVYTRRGNSAPKVGQKKEATIKRASMPKPLENVDYLSNIDVTSNNLDISTVTYGVSDQVAVSAFKKQDEVTKEIPVSDSCKNERSLMSAPQLVVEVPTHRRLDSVSTLGSKSVTSDKLDDFPISFDDDGNDEAIETSPEGSEIGREELESLGDVNNKMQLPVDVQLKNEPELSTDDRIRFLKERIRKMQAASELESLPEQRLQSDDSKVSTAPKIKKLSSKTEILKHIGRPKVDHVSIDLPNQRDFAEQRMKPAHARARDADLEKRLNLQDFDFAETSPVLDNTGIDFATATSRSSERYSSVPSEVTPVLDEFDDVSTIHCDFDHTQRMELIDVELGSTNASEIGHPSKDLASRTKRQVVQCFRKGTQKVAILARQANSSLGQYAVYQRLQAYVVGLWMKYMHGRSPTEQAIIGIMVLSVFIFCILLISIVSG